MFAARKTRLDDVRLFALRIERGKRPLAALAFAFLLEALRFTSSCKFPSASALFAQKAARKRRRAHFSLDLWFGASICALNGLLVADFMRTRMSQALAAVSAHAARLRTTRKRI